MFVHKGGSKKCIRNEKRKKKFKMQNDGAKSVHNSVTTLSKRQVSSNWLTFIKSSGLKGKLVDVNKIDSSDKKMRGTSEKKPAVTKVLALDCEMVSDQNDQDMLARVSVVNFRLECIYDKFVKPVAKVGDYRTRFSGIREEDLEQGEDFEVVRNEVKSLLYNKILVGHALHNDFRVLKFGHHKQLIRDTSRYALFREGSDSKSPSLKKLTKVFLNENIQEGEHNSVEDARATMKLYKKFRQEWEMSLLNSKNQLKESQSKAKLIEGDFQA